FSPRPNAAGRIVLDNLLVNRFEGEIHLVGRSGGSFENRPVLASIDELSPGIDVAIFTLPAAAVKEALEACGRRKIKAAVIFASGFAEVGNQNEQDDLARIAAEAGVAILGPNCIGYSNYVDGVSVWLVNAAAVPRLAEG